MMRLDQTTGGSYGDIVVWRWDRKYLWWEATLKDGTNLRVEMRRRARKTLWRPVVWNDQDTWRGEDYCATPDAAQNVAFKRWRDHFEDLVEDEDDE